jgi:hypothetical protein
LGFAWPSARSDVLTQFLVESVVMSLLGGIVGLAAGWRRVDPWSCHGLDDVNAGVGGGDRSRILGGSRCVFRLLSRSAGSGVLNPIQALRHE